MNTPQNIAITNVTLMAAVAVAWLAGFRGAAFIAVGTATFGFAFLWPQYKTERGVWMGGLLILFFTAFAIFIGLFDLLRPGADGDASRSLYSTTAIVAGIVTLALFFAFVVYATAVNYRLSRIFEQPHEGNTEF